MPNFSIPGSQVTQAPSVSSIPVDPTLWGSLLPWVVGPHGANLAPMYLRRPQRRYTIGSSEHHDFPLPGFQDGDTTLCAIEWDGDESSESAVTFTNLSDMIRISIDGKRIPEATCRILRPYNNITFAMASTVVSTGVGAEIEHTYSFRRYIDGPEDDQIPREVRDKYDIQRTLGSGAYATVVKALHITEHQFYAIKLFHKNVVNVQLRDRVRADPAARQLRKEIDVLSKLRHKCIVEFKEAIYGTKGISIVMELVPGGDLATYMDKHKTIAESETKYFASQIVDALAYLHNAGVAHRDLKPENVLLTGDQPPIVKLADFGMSKIVNSRTALRTQCGTPLYMAPEIFQDGSQGYDYSVDSWSLGVMLYMMLVGRSPFSGRASKAVDWHPLDVVKLSLPGRSFIDALLRYDPRGRMSSASACQHEWLFHNPLPVAASGASNPQRSQPQPSSSDRVVRSPVVARSQRWSPYVVPLTRPSTLARSHHQLAGALCGASVGTNMVATPIPAAIPTLGRSHYANTLHTCMHNHHMPQHQPPTTCSHVMARRTSSGTARSPAPRSPLARMVHPGPSRLLPLPPPLVPMSFMPPPCPVHGLVNFGPPDRLAISPFLLDPAPLLWDSSIATVFEVGVDPARFPPYSYMCLP